jgi:uncharacterized protein YdeI (YjbR/CyaY-like superfamily)
VKIGKTLYARNRREWRSWLAKHGKTEREIWLIYYKKESGKPRIPYNDAVEEALCYGWIDSILKPIDKQRYAQRFSPRKKTSKLSDMNRERVARLIKAGKMTKIGLAALDHVAKRTPPLSAEVVAEIKKNATAWKYFQKFPASYKRIRVGWIAAGKVRPAVYRQRLAYFIKMTAQNKRFGMVQ